MRNENLLNLLTVVAIALPPPHFHGLWFAWVAGVALWIAAAALTEIRKCHKVGKSTKNCLMDFFVPTEPSGKSLWSWLVTVAASLALGAVYIEHLPVPGAEMVVALPQHWSVALLLGLLQEAMTYMLIDKIPWSKLTGKSQ